MVKCVLILLALAVGVAYGAPGFVDLGTARDTAGGVLGGGVVGVPGVASTHGLGRISEDGVELHGSAEVLGLGRVGGAGGVGPDGIGGVGGGALGGLGGAAGGALGGLPTGGLPTGGLPTGALGGLPTGGLGGLPTGGLPTGGVLG
ncbi:acanthoscurrin-1-like [Homalodisca vitripennis]|uniref:acanthoscurrin-1-like n=1 Tax=Homalodisca vitripennis TaxID=197043 RepID=UPI001EEBE523|nr:acanthoscurrin-1-like [Homalodisca vitripennis]